MKQTEKIFTFTFSWPCLLTGVEGVERTEPLFACTFIMSEKNSNS